MRQICRPMRSVAVLAATMFLLPACHKNGGSSGGNPGSGGGGGGGQPMATFQPGAIVDADGVGNPLRVDLPGRLSVLVQVTDLAGNPVAGLTNENFALFEDSQLVSPTESQQQLLPKPRVFRSFSHLLLDISGSVASTPGGQQREIDAAKRFIEEVTAEEENYVAISWFFGGQAIAPALLDNLSPLGFTNNRDLLIEAVENVELIQVTSTSTNLYGAIIQGLDVLDTALTTTNSGIEFQSLTLVTFTDGTDQAGLFSQEDAIQRLAAGPNNYFAQAIGLGSEIDTPTLNAIGPNGYVLADDLDDLESLFEVVGSNVRDQANSFYFVGYISPKVHSNQVRTLTVQASREGNTASRDYEFVPQYFSGGGGFLEAQETNVLERVAEWVDMAASDGGNTLMLSRNAGPGDIRQAMKVRSVNQDLATNMDFGIRGEVLIEDIFAYDYFTPQSLAVAPNGRIYVLAQAKDHADDNDPRLVLAILSATGEWIDSIMITPVVSGIEEARDIVVTSDGFVMVLSQVGDAPNTRTALRRFEPTSMALDETFASGGVRLLSAHPSGQFDNPQAMVADAQGGVYYTGSGYNTESAMVDMMVVHVQADGTLNSQFGNSGLAMSQSQIPSAGPGLGHHIRLDPNQRIVVGGEVLVAGSAQPRAAFWKLLPNGNFDNSFFGNASNPYFQTGLVALGGILTQDPNVLFGLDSRVTQLRILGDGSLFALGARTNARGDQDVCTWRLGLNGLFDPSYNFTGFLIEDGSLEQGADDTPTDVRFLPNGNVLICGKGQVLGTADSKGVVWIDSDPIRLISTP